MTTAKLKQQLHNYIEQTDDAVLLEMIKEDFLFFGKSGADVTDNLKPEQLQELEALAHEPDTKESMTLTEYKTATRKWRTK